MRKAGDRFLHVAGLVLALISIGCGGGTTLPLNVQVGASVDHGVAPLDVDFTATVVSGNEPLEFSWDFGDGGTSTDQNPSHTFTQAGEFTVSLTVTDAKQQTATESLTITVAEQLQVTVAADPTDGIVPLLVNLSSQVSGGTEPFTYAWDFGDGGSADSPSPSHLYQVSGTFDATLTVSDSWGQTAQASVTITARDDHVPVAAITANPTVGVTPLEVAFQGNAVGGDAPLSYSWNFGDGETSDEQNPTHTFTNPGTYTVVLVVTDADGDEGTDTVDIQVASNQTPVVEIEAEPQEGIEPLRVRLAAKVAGGNPPITYAWDFDGDGNVDSSLPEVMHTFSAGQYQVSVTVTDADGDTASDQVTIDVAQDTEPVVTAQADPQSGLAPLTVSFTCTATGINLPYRYSWDFGDGQVSTLQNPSYTYTRGGTFEATCKVTDADGDSATGSVTIQVTEDLTPRVSASADPNSGLAPLDVQFSATVESGNPPFTYSWDFGDGSGTSSQANPSYTYTAAGSYTATVTVTDSDGDTASAQVGVSVGDATTPAVSAAADPTNGPAPLRVSFTCTATGGNSPYGYHWNFGDGTSSEQQNPTHTYTAVGDYLATCIVTDSFGQTGQGTVSISATNPNLPPVIDSLESFNGWPADSVPQNCAAVNQTEMQLLVTAHDQNTPPDPLAYQWVFEEMPPGSRAALNNDTVINPTFTPDRPGDYVLRVFVRDGRGGEASQAITITAELPGMVEAVSPLSPSPGQAAQPYPDPLVARVTTQCGVPFQGASPTWTSSNGHIDWTEQPSDDQGLVQAWVTLGCDVTASAEFTAAIGDSPDRAVFSIPVQPGPAEALTVFPDQDVPVADSSGNPNPMNVAVRVTDRCGNLVTDTDVTFSLRVEWGNACFDDLCPSQGGTGTQDKTGLSTSGGEFSLQAYSTDADWVVFRPYDVSGGLQFAGGWAARYFIDFEADNGGFWPDGSPGREQEWEYGKPAAGAHSGFYAWDTVLNGDYAPQPDSSGWSALFGWLDVPCNNFRPIELRFHHRYQIGANAVGYLMAGDPLYGTALSPADAASAYNSEVSGHQGYGGDSGGWQLAKFDLSSLAMNSCWDPNGDFQFPLYWTLFLDQATETAPGWTIDDVSVWYISDMAMARFVAGPYENGVIQPEHNGVAGCQSSPAAVHVRAYDVYGNPASYATVDLQAAAAGTVVYQGADPGSLLSDDGAGNAQVMTNYNGEAVIGFTDDTAETVTVTLPAPGGDQNTTVDFVDQVTSEAGLCNDGMDNDCDGNADCADDDCLSDPVCLPDLSADWATPRVQGGNQVEYDIQWCNNTPVDANGSYQVAVFVVPQGTPFDPTNPPQPVVSNTYFDLGAWTCSGDTFYFNLNPGGWDLYFWVDFGNQITESDETNNLYGPDTVTVSPPQTESDDSGNCLNGMDDDSDGSMDCEQTGSGPQDSCRYPGRTLSCESSFDDYYFGGQDEICDGSDTLQIGIIDLFACKCNPAAGNNGCDQIDPTFPYICWYNLTQIGFEPTCAPPCTVFCDYQNDPQSCDSFCAIISNNNWTFCDPASGLCQ